MAKLVETVAIIKISRLVKDDEVLSAEADIALLDQLKEVAEELVGDSHAMIEVVIAE